MCVELSVKRTGARNQHVHDRFLCDCGRFRVSPCSQVRRHENASCGCKGVYKNDKRRCPHCKTFKEQDEFGPNDGNRKCLACRRSPEYYQTLKISQFMWRYDAPKSVIEDLLSREACDICNKVFTDSKTAHIDHDHKTGKIRGRLCANCNSGIGMLQDDVTVLEKAAAYLKRSK